MVLVLICAYLFSFLVFLLLFDITINSISITETKTQNFAACVKFPPLSSLHVLTREKGMIPMNGEYRTLLSCVI